MLIKIQGWYSSPEDGGAAAPGGEASAPPGDAGPTGEAFPDFSNIDFDKMFSSMEPQVAAQEGQQQPGQQPAGDGGGNAPEPPQPPAVPSGEVPPVQTPDELATLRSTVENLQGQLRAQQELLLRAAQPQPQAQPQGQPQRFYDMRIPEQLLPKVAEMIRSENPLEVGQALSFLLNESAEITHRTVLAQVAQMIQSVVPQHLQGMSQQAEIANDFYTAYPRLNHPRLKPMIRDIAVQIARERGYTSWNAQFRKEVAERAVRELRSMFPTGGRPGAGRPPAAPPNGHARAGTPLPVGSDPNSPEAIADTIFG